VANIKVHYVKKTQLDPSECASGNQPTGVQMIERFGVKCTEFLAFVGLMFIVLLSIIGLITLLVLLLGGSSSKATTKALVIPHGESLVCCIEPSFPFPPLES